MSSLRHENIVQLLDHGYDGIVKCPGKLPVKHAAAFLVMEYIEGECLFDVAVESGAIGEDAGKALYNQVLDVLEYLDE